MKLSINIKLIAFLLLLFCCFANYISYAQSDFYELFNINNVKEHISILASDSLEGRGTGTKGERLAAEYIKTEIHKNGLIPFADDGTYLQSIPMHGSFALPSSQLRIYDDTSTFNLTNGIHYILLKHGEQTLISKPVEMVFAGYGIVAPEYDYNDYQNINVEGKVVVVLSGEPHSENEKYFAGYNQTIYSLAEAKHRMAISRGARGLLIIPSFIKFSNENWNHLLKEYSFEDVTMPSITASNFLAYLHPAVAERLFLISNLSFDKIVDNHFSGKIKSINLSSRLSFRGVFKERDFIAHNVIGSIKGIDKKFADSYLVVTAHYDHLGIGIPFNGDSIYNGLTDNALGTSVLIELSRLLKQTKTKRSIIIMFVTGEEKGLLGSRYFIQNPVVENKKMVANLNIDGIASMGKFKKIVGLGGEYSNLKEYLQIVANGNGVELTTIPPIFEQTESFYKSDQLSFAQAGIPSINVVEAPFFENYSEDESIAMVKEYFEKIYHLPTDDLAQQINFDAVKQHSKILFDFIIEIANSSAVPTWNIDSPYYGIGLRLKSGFK